MCVKWTRTAGTPGNDEIEDAGRHLLSLRAYAVVIAWVHTD